MLLEQIADYAIKEQTSKLPDDVIHHAKRAVIDWYAALLPGSRVAPATLLEQAFAEDLDRGSARLASGRHATLRAAALINGAASHSVEFDDIYRDAGYHPGSPVISAALAAAQATGASGEKFLRGVIVGYEVSTRIGEAVMPSHYRYWHTTGTVGCFGAAAAVATILGCNRQQFMHALATVGTFAAGLQQAFRSQAMTKPLHGGHAADAGAMSAMAAAKGVTGALDILEGEVGFGAAMSVNPDWSKATRGLGKDYHINHMTFKNHGCCGHTFPSIDGVLELKQKHNLTHKDIKKIRLASYKAGLDIIDNATPEGEYQAKFSIQYTVAHALVHGSVRLNAFLPDRMNDPDVRALMTRIEVVADPELSKGYPTQRAAQVEIETYDGRNLSHFQPTRKGDPEMPLTDEELNDKFLELATPVIGAGAARALLEQLWRTDKLANVDYETSPQKGPRVLASV
ncbi:MAG: 2-methylcitrate dehydratase [Betaproteobacteria bacterium]|jgi:2-methylcitrate dehydratase PrpD|nr:2-methylcitrate dehydratase [Betaproteobacteria bacterium]